MYVCVGKYQQNEINAVTDSFFFSLSPYCFYHSRWKSCSAYSNYVWTLCTLKDVLNAVSNDLSSMKIEVHQPLSSNAQKLKGEKSSRFSPRLFFIRSSSILVSLCAKHEFHNLWYIISLQCRFAFTSNGFFWFSCLYLLLLQPGFCKFSVDIYSALIFVWKIVFFPFFCFCDIENENKQYTNTR